MRSKKMTDLELERCAEILRVLEHPIRLQIVHQLVKKRLLNVSALQQLLNLPQSTVSQHLHKMRNHKVLSHDNDIPQKNNRKSYWL